jgi:hypothetical protein
MGHRNLGRAAEADPAGRQSGSAEAMILLLDVNQLLNVKELDALKDGEG